MNARGGADKKESNRSKMNVLGEEWQKGGLRREQTLSSVFFCSLNLNPKIPLSFLFYVLRLSFPVAAFLYVFVFVKPSFIVIVPQELAGVPHFFHRAGRDWERVDFRHFPAALCLFAVLREGAKHKNENINTF